LTAKLLTTFLRTCLTHVTRKLRISISRKMNLYKDFYCCDFIKLSLRSSLYRLNFLFLMIHCIFFIVIVTYCHKAICNIFYIFHSIPLGFEEEPKCTYFNFIFIYLFFIIFRWNEKIYSLCIPTFVPEISFLNKRDLIT